MLGAGVAPALLQTAASRPNILFLISDDHSAPDLGCYGNSAVRTPNLDRMAGAGARFDNCFAMSPQCSPTRSSILTGCAPHTTLTSRLHTPMPPWQPTFLEPLKERGYFTGAFRKVHQGPLFDKRWDFYGGPKAAFEEFFDARPADRPFFLHVGFTDPHRPYAAGAFSPPHDPGRVLVPSFLPDSPEVRADIAYYYDEIARMDSECGRLLQILAGRKLAENTLIFFTGDNGMPFPRAKGTCYDSGLKVPLLAWWPGKIRPGRVVAGLVSHADFAPTFLEAAGIPKPERMQGRSFAGALLERPFEPRGEVFAERNWHDNFDLQRAIRTDRHKLIFNAVPHQPYRPIWDLAMSPSWQSYVELGKQEKLAPAHRRLLEPARPMLELYDLAADPGEFHNLISSPQHTGVREDLLRRLSAWMQDTWDFLPPQFRL